MSGKNKGSTTTIQSDVVEVTQAEIDVFQATAFAEGVSSERTRITQIRKDADALNVSGDVVQTLIENNSTVEQAKTMLFAVREGIDKNSSIHTSNDGSGGDDQEKKSSHLLSSYQKAKGIKK